MEPMRPDGDTPPPRDRPLLRLTSDHDAAAQPDARDGPYVTDRLTALSRELETLVNGSLESLEQARRSLPAVQAAALPLAASLDATRRKLARAHESIERLATLLHGAMGSASEAVPPTEAQVPHGITLEAAIAHAAEALAPLSSGQGIACAVRIDPRCAHVPAGPLYVVVFQALANAIEAAGAAGAGGHVEIRADVVNLDQRPWMRLEIVDNGPGVPPQATCGGAFRFGMTTRGAGRGVGLALAAEIVAALGGTISLETVRSGSVSRPGAVLRVACPCFPGPVAGESGSR